MNLPNILTFIRFLLVPLYFVVFFSDLPGRMYWALLIVLFAGLTDVVDGYLARKYKQITQIGIMLDPLADKLMMLVVFLSLLLAQHISIWQASAIFLRDLGMIISSIFFHFRGKKTVPANILGKATTIFFYMGLFLVMLNYPFASIFLWFVIIFSYVTTWIYLLQIRSINEKYI